jgi:hypothetical protein
VLRKKISKKTTKFLFFTADFSIFIPLIDFRRLVLRWDLLEGIGTEILGKVVNIPREVDPRGTLLVCYLEIQQKLQRVLT